MTHRRLAVGSAIAVVLTAAFLTGSGVGSSAVVASGAQGIRAGLAAAIHARLGAGAIRSSSASRVSSQPPLLGSSVALSADGTTALVGAPGVASGRGAAYIFHVSDAGSWSSSASPTAVLTNGNDTSLGQGFGFSVALSADGTTAFVGAPGDNGDPPGAIYAFHVAPEDAWASSSTPMATLTVSDGYLGLSLALSHDGTTLVTGGLGIDGFAGGAYVFHASGEDAWASTSTPTATLSNADDPNDSAVGYNVAISGDGTTALLSDIFNLSRGGAFLYHVSAEDAWATNSTPTAILSDANRAVNGGFLGYSLALSGDGTVAFLGSPEARPSFSGAVDVFHTSAEAAWASTSTPSATLRGGRVAEEAFGQRVAVSSDGRTVLVNATGFHDGRGGAYVFRASGEEAWASSPAPKATLTSSGRKPLGSWEPGASALSAEGTTALLADLGFRFGTGGVDVFHVSKTSSWASSSNPTGILTDSALVECVVPRLKGFTILHARSALTRRSCHLGRVKHVQSAAKKRGRVISQSRKPGSRRPVGTKVNVKVKK